MTEPAVDWRDHMGLVHLCITRLLQKRPHTRVERCDLISDHTQILVRCAEPFDPSRGYAFSTYAIKSMTLAGGDIMRVAQGYKRNHNWDHQSTTVRRRHGGMLDMTDRVASLESPPHMRMDLDERSEAIDTVLALLSERDQDIVRCVMVGGEEQTSFARRHGVTRSVISFRVQQIRKFLTRDLAEYGITATNRLGAA